MAAAAESVEALEAKLAKLRRDYISDCKGAQDMFLHLKGPAKNSAIEAEVEELTEDYNKARARLLKKKEAAEAAEEAAEEAAAAEAAAAAKEAKKRKRTAPAAKAAAAAAAADGGADGTVAKVAKAEKAIAWNERCHTKPQEIWQDFKTGYDIIYHTLKQSGKKLITNQKGSGNGHVVNRTVT